MLPDRCSPDLQESLGESRIPHKGPDEQPRPKSLLYSVRSFRQDELSVLVPNGPLFRVRNRGVYQD